jgi:DNA ligase (NAD+)
MDITDNVKAMATVPNTLPSGFSGEVRLEVYMPKTSFERNNEALRRNGEKAMANPRNAANGSVTCQNPKVTAKRGLDVFWYDVIPEDGTEFETESEKRAFGAAQLDGIPAVELQVISVDDFGALAIEWEQRRPTLDYEIDGLVGALQSLGDQDDAGFSSKNPNGKIAFKFKPEQQTSTVRGIDYQVGRTGRMTPVCRIEPTYIAGSTVSNLTLHNQARVRELGVAIGDEILFEKAGDIIPQVVRVTDKKASDEHHPAPATCPACSGEVEDDGTSLWCTNPACSAKLEERVNHWLKRLGVLGIGPSTVQGLCQSGQVKDLSDLYYLDQNAVRGITGGDRAAEKVVVAILEKNDIPLWQFLSGLGIHGLGRSTSKVVAKEFKTLVAVRNATVSTLDRLEGIGSTSALGIIHGLKMMETTIDRLIECIDVVDVVEASGPLVGKTFCLTGAMPSGRKRKEVVEIIEAAGGEFKSSVGKGLGYLIIADPSSQSSKAVKARKLGTQCISEDELMEMIG